MLFGFETRRGTLIGCTTHVGGVTYFVDDMADEEQDWVPKKGSVWTWFGFSRTDVLRLEIEHYLQSLQGNRWNDWRQYHRLVQPSKMKTSQRNMTNVCHCGRRLTNSKQDRQPDPNR